MIERKPEMSEEDVLFEFSQESERDASVLEKYINQYPEYREALVAMSVDLTICPVDEFASDPKSISSERTERVWSQFQALLGSSDPALIKTSSEENPLTKLDQKHFIQAAKNLDVTRAFLTRFRDSSVLVNTIPAKFIQKMAGLLGVEFEKLRSSLDSSPSISVGVSFKAEKNPVANQKVTFDVAIENSGLSDEQKEKLQNMKV